jgi:hypothetical protein
VTELLQVVLILAMCVVLIGLGVLVASLVAGTPTDRERALEAKIDALKRANRIGVAYFNAQAEMREEMARPVGRARVGGRRTVEGEWR